MSKSAINNPFLTELKDKNGESWYHQIILEEKDKEIERINNIINELEESLKDDKEEYNKDLDLETKELYNEYWRGYSVCADKNLAYLQELKGDGSNE